MSCPPPASTAGSSGTHIWTAGLITRLSLAAALGLGLGLGLGLAACSDYQFAPADTKPVGDSTSTGVCTDVEADSVTAPDIDDSCLREPVPGSFTPQLEWQWSSNADLPGYDQIMATPAVGDVDGDGLPEVVFSTFTSSSYGSAGALTVLHGDSGELVWSKADIGGEQIYGDAGVAIADLDGDGIVEICVAGVTSSVVCATPAGDLKWAAGDEPYSVGCPAVADLDADGSAELIFGRQVFSADGTPRWVGDGGAGGPNMSFAVDINGDGLLEVIAGNTVYDAFGNTLWNDGQADGIPAVGDFDLDGVPEIVRTANSTVMLTTADGSLLWQTAVPGGGGGAPTVADYDGDGYPEVGVAGLSLYTMFDTDGSVVWSNATEDVSSSVTGSSVFDFEGDGQAEVVYADEHNLFVYDGATGSVRMQLTDHSSGTLYEYPLVADVDGDGSSEIIVASNNYAFAGWNGITVIGDADSSWAPARPIWNQFAYHISNINSDGSVPAVQEENWTKWNNFRAAGTELGPGHWLADLSPGDPQACLLECSADRVIFYLPVQNSGLLDATTFKLQIGRASADPIVDKVVTSLAAGSVSVLGPFEASQSDWGSGSLYATVDAERVIDECNEDNNLASLGRWPCP